MNGKDSSPVSSVANRLNLDFRPRLLSRLWLLSLLIVGCGPLIVIAEDTIPTPPLEEGALLIFHPIIVHFAIALTCFGLVLDWWGSLRNQSGWQQAGKICFFAGVVALGGATLSGWIEHELARPSSA